MDKKYKPILVFTMAISKAGTTCFWCGQVLGECIRCKGTGTLNDSRCESCEGNGRLCPTHDGHWSG